MATVTDILVTQLRILGVREVRAGLNDAQFAFTQMAEAQNLATAASGALHTAFGALNSPLAQIGLVAGIVTAEIGFLVSSVKAFSQSEDSIARVATQMRLLGNTFPIDDLIEFSGRLSHLTGIDDELITTLGASAARFGLNRAQIEKMLPTVLDLAVALKKNPEDVLRTIERASRGRPQGLVTLGIDPTKIKGDLKDINNLINQIGRGVEGTAVAFRGTLPGTLVALNTATTNFQEAVGRFFSPAVVAVLNYFISNLEVFTAVLTKLADLLHLPTAAALGQGKASPLALKGDPEQTGLLGEIAKNTAALSPFVDKVLGGTGEVAARSFTWRDARAGFGI